jgi:hypothetical protein
MKDNVVPSRSRWLAAISTFVALTAPVSYASAAAAETNNFDDPFAGRIVRVVYKWGKGSSWGFMLLTEANGRRCIRPGNPGFRPKPSDITKVSYKLCFAPGQTKIDRSAVTASRSFVVRLNRYAIVETYYAASIDRDGTTLDIRLHPCTRVRGESQQNCRHSVRYRVRLHGPTCGVRIWDDRFDGHRPEIMCEHYAAR